MSWGVLLALAACAYGFKLLGLVIIGSRPLPAVVDRCLLLVPAALLSALVVKDVFSSGQDLVLDARAGGLPWPSSRRGDGHRSSSWSGWLRLIPLLRQL